MPDNILSKRLARWRTAYRNSGLRRFLDWWGQELAALLPERLRSALVERRDELRVERVAEGGWTVRRIPGDDAADGIALPADWRPGDDVIVPTAGSCGVTKERMEVPEEGVTCHDWFFCTKKLEKEKVEEALGKKM